MHTTGRLGAGDLDTVIVITVTPFDAGGELSEAALEGVVEHAVSGGISVLVPGGNTSEYYRLSQDEWRRSVEIAVAQSRGRAHVVPGVGGDLATAVAQARAARALGCPAVMVHQPIGSATGEGWVEYHRRIAREVAGTGLVAYVRDPARGADDIVRLVESVGPLVGVKYAVADPGVVARLAARIDTSRTALVCGLAERGALAFSAAGAKGFTSGLGGVVPRLSLSIADRLSSGDYEGARQLLAVMDEVEEIRIRDGSAYSTAAVKEALAQLGICGRAVRPPASELPEPMRPAVTAFLERARSAVRAGALAAS